MAGRLSAIDARMYWLSRVVASDQFLLYAFDGELADPDGAVRDLLRRAGAVADLGVRLRETPWNLDYPYWIPSAPTRDQVRIGSACEWGQCLQHVTELFMTRVDARVSPWLLHLFPRVTGVPGARGPSTVVVLQISHALADGGHASLMARSLFGHEATARPSAPRRAVPVPLAAARGVAELPIRMVRTAVRARAALLAARARDVDTASGVIPPASEGRSPTVLSRPPAGSITVRCVVLDAGELTNAVASVTVTAVVAISVALSELFESVQAPVPSDLGAEVTVAIPPEHRTTNARNAFHNVGVDLHPGIGDLRERAAAVTASLTDRRRRLAHPAFGAGDRATEAVPAFLLARDVDRMDLSGRPDSVTGHTVVSSVNRGAADLEFSGNPVIMTAGFPALSPSMGITHGVHGIGGTVTISVTTSEGVVPDVDGYASALRRAVGRVQRALSEGT